MHPDPFATLTEIRRRSTEAVLGQSGLNHAGLAAEIRMRFNSADPDEGGLLAEPVIEAAPRYVEADLSMEDLAHEGLLSPKLVDALDGAGETLLLDGRERYRFGRDWRPYHHQLEAWRALLAPEPRSVLVSSGTGSGKTECFLIPLFESLLRSGAQAEESGVRAVVLYPLNALIASQRERLSDWTRPFNGRVRFGLYNGLTPRRVEDRERRLTPEQAVDRETLRSDPPAILVTNVTMLEYMLLRREDAPILQRSQGKLQYVVLDEAHSYVGAQAAEIALLLRRVCLAFGVEPEHVRFVATSATIGGPDAEADLRRFLADVSGASPEQCLVVTGKSRWAPLPKAQEGPPLSAHVLDSLDEGEAGRVLAGHDGVRALLERLRLEPAPWSALIDTARRVGSDPTALAMTLSRAKLDGEPLSPLRVHGFHRAVGGMWTCLNPGCSGSRPSGWTLGALAWDDEAGCRYCGSQTFQILHCHECGEPWIETVETASGALQRPVQRPPGEDFGEEVEDIEPEDIDDPSAAGETGGAAYERLLAVRPLISKSVAPLRPVFVDPVRAHVHHGPGEGVHRLLGVDNTGACASCGKSPTSGAKVIRPIRFGAPFLLPNATPVLLEGVSPLHRHDQGVTPPMGGRQLLSFTDSRQGTARIAAKLQIGSERNAVRSVIYHAVQQAASITPDTTAITAEIDLLSAAMERLPPEMKGGLQPIVDGKIADRAKLVAGGMDGIAWPELRDRLASRSDLDTWLRPLWRGRENRYESATDFANFLMLREFMRRPRRANTLETLGLARLRFADIDGIADGRTPAAFTSLGGAPSDWRDFLMLLATISFRANSAVDANRDDQHWIQPKLLLKWIVKGANEEASSIRIRFPWAPLGRTPWPRPSRPVRLLAQAFGLNLDDPEARAAISDVLDAAWLQLSPVLTREGASARIDLRKAHVAPVDRAWFCPVTRRVLDVTFCGLSPYGADPSQG